ncbi:MAG: DnaA/Hda family protein [Candidatus Sumerlaeaceae bacterium]|nr:DnaA/Hda family protein [Candidatus Sumerlaeaceae bacterium]
MGIYSEKAIQELNEQLDPRAVLELIGYHTEKLQESAETFRGFCPIHRETVFRTLIIDKSRRSFRCMYSLCKGAAGGTLVELYALARDLPLEKAVEELGSHFGIEVSLPADPEYLEKQAEVAENYLELGYYEEAEKTYQEILQADANFERARRGLLQVYEHLGNTEALGEQHAVLAQLMLQRGERLAAYEHVKTWAEYQPDAPKAHYVLAEYLLEEGNREAALEEFMTAADLYTAREEFQEAIEAYRQADSLRLDLVDVVPHVLQVYEQMGKPEEAAGFLAERAEAAVLHADFLRAAQLLEQALELVPHDATIRLRLCEVAILADAQGDWIPRVFEWAQWFVAAGMPEKALQVYERLLDAQPTNEEAVTRLQSLYAALGKAEDAVGLRLRTARLAFEARDFKRAQRELEGILKEQPSHLAALELLVELHLATNKKSDACERLAQLARTYLSNRDFVKAVATFDRILGLMPNELPWRLERAEVLEAWGATGNVRARQQAAQEFEELGDVFAATDLAKACELYGRAEASVPPSAQLLLKRAKCFVRLNNLQGAREYLSRACDELIATGESEAAIEGAREVAALAPHDHELQKYVIDVLEVVGRVNEAVSVAMSQAEAAAQRTEPELVLEYLNRALTLNPNHIPAIEALAVHYHGAGDTANYCDVLLRLANANEQQGNLAGAVAALERLVDEREEDVIALGRLAQIHLRLGNVAKSRTYRLQLADIHHRRGALESEREILRALLAEEPEDENVLAALIDCEFALGNGEQACAYAVELANLQRNRGFASLARATLEKAAEKEPDSLPVNKMLFELVRQLGPAEQAVERGLHLIELLQLYDQNDEAVQVFEHVTECAPTDFELFRKYIAFLREIGRTQDTTEKLFSMARRLRATGLFEAAENALRELEQTRPLEVAELEESLALYEQWGKIDDFAQRAIELAQTYDAQGQGKKSLTLLRRALKVTSGHPLVRKQLADAYLGQGRTADAVRELMQLASGYGAAGKKDDELETLRRAAGLAPTDRQVRTALVEALRERGDHEAAIAQLEDLAAALMTAKDYDGALEILDQIVAQHPERLGARRMRADLYTALGDKQRAQEDLNAFYLQSLLRQADDYHERGDLVREAATLREALKIVPDNESLLRRTRNVEFEGGELEEACATTLELVRLLNRQHRTKESLELLRDACERVPDNIFVAQQLFETLCGQGATEEATALGVKLAYLLLAEHETGKAINVFEEVLTIATDRQDAEQRYAEFLEKAGQTDKAVAQYLSAGRLALEKGDWAAAQVCYSNALRLHPHETAAFEGMAEIAAHAGRVEEQADWLGKLALVHLERGETDAAIEGFERAIRIQPTRVDLREQLIGVLVQQAKIDSAVKELHELADVLNRQGDQAGALAAEERAVELAPNDVAARRRLAETLVMLNDLERGVAEFEQLSATCADKGDFAQALAVLEEAQALVPARLSVRKIKADIFERMGDHERAALERKQFEVAKALQEAESARQKRDFKSEKKALRKALEIAPADESVWQRLIQCHHDLGETDEEVAAYLKLAELQKEKHGPTKGRATLEQALGTYPGEERLLRALFTVCREMRDDVAVRQYAQQLIGLAQVKTDGPERALEIYDELLTYLPDDVALYLDVADYCAKSGRLGAALARLVRGADLAADAQRLADAERLLLHALNLSPKSTECLVRLVRLYERTGRTADFEKFLLELATAYEEGGDLVQAVATARRLTLVSPENVPARQFLVRLLQASGQTHAAVEEQLALVGVLQQIGALQAAVEAAREALSLSEGSERARRTLADCLAAAGDVEAANGELEELAKFYAEQERFDKAVLVLDEIIERSPKRMSSRIMRAEMYAKLGQAERALEEYREISAAVATGAMAAASVPATPVIPTLQIVPEYDFDHFVVGANNNFAYATALAVARAPAQAYNPLFIYSDVGLGKTHLVNAIANHILRENPNVRIIYTNSEDFTAEVVEAIQTNTINQFRAKYKSVDLLIVDDVQFLAGKERAQEEFFHIFNALFQAKKQIVITSDRPPKDIARLENRLLSRFGAGVIVDIAAPDFETRIAILNREIERAGLEIPLEVVHLIAEHIDTNVRELKGALNQVVAMRTIQGKEINEANVRQMLEALYGKKRGDEDSPGKEPTKEKKRK